MLFNDCLMFLLHVHDFISLVTIDDFTIKIVKQKYQQQSQHYLTVYETLIKGFVSSTLLILIAIYLTESKLFNHYNTIIMH